MFLEKLNAAVCYMTVILDIILSEIVFKDAKI